LQQVLHLAAFDHVSVCVSVRTKTEQVAQLSQRDRAAGWVSYGQKKVGKWETIFYGQYMSIFNHYDVIGQQRN